MQGWLTSFLYPPNLSQEPRDYGVSEGGAPGEEASVRRRELVSSSLNDAVCVVFVSEHLLN